MNKVEKSISFWSVTLIIFTVFVTGQVQADIWTTYTETSFVSGIAAAGNDVWAGTTGGVVHWDIPSTTYIKYTVSEGLADQWVKEVLIDNSGDLWFGTKEGVQHFDGLIWTTYNESNSPLPNNLVYSIVQDLSGDMWFGTDFGCAKFDGVSWEVFTDLGGGATNVAVRGIDVDSLNQIWTANNPDNYGDPGGVSMYDGISWHRHDPDTGSIGQYFLSLAVDNSDNVWAGSWTNYAFVYNGASWTHYDTGNSGLVGTNVEAIEVDAASNVWIGNHASSYSDSTNGLIKYDGSTWTTYTTASSGLPASFIYSISADAGTVYMGTGSHGTSSFNGSAWNYYLTSYEPHTNWITSIDRGIVGLSDAGLYFGTHHYGIARYMNGNWSSYTTINSDLGDNYVNDIYIEDGTLWVGSQYSGLWEFDGTTWVNYNSGNSGLLGDIIISIDSDSFGTLWMGTSGWSGPGGQSGAVAKYDGSTWTNYYLNNSGLIDDDGLQVFVDSSDIIWIGTHEEGVSRFDGGSSWTDYHTGNSGLIDNHIQAIAFDTAGGTWFATLGGVSHLDSGDVWTSYTTADGLPSNQVTDIIVTDAGNFWIATEGGAAIYEPGVGWTAYTQEDGLGDNDVTAVETGYNDLIWFGTYNSGISSFNPATAPTPTSGPTGTPTQPPDVPATSSIGILMLIAILSVLVVISSNRKIIIDNS